MQKTKKHGRQVAALLLTLVLMWTALPGAVFAEGVSENTSLAAQPEASTAPTEEPEESSAPTQEPEESSAPTQEPEESSAPTQEPEESSTPTQEPEESSTPTQEPEESSTPTQEPEESSTPTQEPEESSTPTQEPEESSTPTQEPEESASSSQAPKRRSGQPVVQSSDTYEWSVDSKTLTIHKDAGFAEWKSASPEISPADIVTAGIGEAVTYIPADAFEGCTSISRVIMNNSQPCTLEEGGFSDLPEAFIFIVPTGTNAAYKGAEIWRYYSSRITSYDFMIGEKSYTNWKDAIADVPAGTETTIKLMADYIIPNIVFEVAADKIIVLDLNGKTLTTENSASPALVVSGSLTVNDSAGEGKIQSQGKIIQAVNANSKVTLLGGAFESGGAEIIEDTVGCVILISGSTLRSYVSGNDAGVIVSNGGSVTLKGIASVSTVNGIGILNKGTGPVSIEDNASIITGSMAAVCNEGTGKITVKGNAKLSSSCINYNPKDKGTIQINAVPSPAATMVDIQGGTVENTNENGYAVYFAPESVTFENRPGYYTTTSGTVGRVHPENIPTFTIGDKVYKTLEEAIKAAPATGVETLISLNKNYSFDKKINLSKGQNIVLNLNKSKLKFTGDAGQGYAIGLPAGTSGAKLKIAVNGLSGGSMETENAVSLILVEGNNELEIAAGYLSAPGTNNKPTIEVKSTSEKALLISGGKIINKGYAAVSNSGAGRLTMTNGEVETANAVTGAIHNNSTGALDLSGGKVKSTGKYAIYNAGTGKITVSNTAQIQTEGVEARSIYLAQVPASPSLILEVNGGTISSPYGDGNYSVYFAPETVDMDNVDLYYKLNSGTVGPIKPTVSNDPFVVDGKTYESLYLAVFNLPSDEAKAVIKLRKDAEFTTKTTFTSNATIDLNGKTLSFTGADSEYNALEAKAKLTITDSSTAKTGKLTTDKNLSLLQNYGDDGQIVVAGGEIYSSGNNPVITNVTRNATGLIISGGVISSGNAVAVFNDRGATAQISAGTVESKTASSCAIDNSGKLNISGGTVKSTDSTETIRNNSNGEIAISGGRVESVSGAAIKVIPGGKVIVSGTATVTSASEKGSIYYDDVPTPEAVVLEISGGTVSNSAEGGYAVNFNSYNVTINNLDKYYKVTGGTIGRVNPEPSDDPFEIDGRFYPTLEEAFRKLPLNGQENTIVVHKDASIENRISISGFRVKIDLNGHTLSYVGDPTQEVFELPGGESSLHITDSSPDKNGVLQCSDSANLIIIRGECTFTATGGTLIAEGVNNSATIYVDSTSKDAVVIDGATIINKKSTSIFTASTGTVHLKSGRIGDRGIAEFFSIYNVKGNFIMTGGTVESGGAAIRTDTGNLTMTGGTIDAGGTAIYAIVDSNIDISGGTLSSAGSMTISMQSHGTLDVSGGTVKSKSHPAIHSYIKGGAGKINISGDALITSSISSMDEGTIYIREVSDPASVILSITGGTVENTVSPKHYSVYYVPEVVTLENLDDYHSSTGGTVGRVYPDGKRKVLQSIAITKNPTKTIYTAGENFDSTGMVVTATYDDKSKAEVSNYTISPGNELKPTDNKIVVSYTLGSVTKTAELAITVKDAPIKPSPSPSTAPSTKPSTEPTAKPSTEPTAKPSTEPTAEPKIKISLPKLVKADYVYTGNTVQPEFTGFDDSLMNIEGNTATELGSYKAIVSLKDNSKYEWYTDKNQAGKWAYSWRIIANERKDKVPDGNSGAIIEGIDGTTFDPATELIVLPEEGAQRYEDKVTTLAPGNSIAGIYSVRLLLNGAEIQPDGKIKIKLPLTDAMKSMKDLKAIFIDDDDNISLVSGEVEGDYMAIITDHLSFYGIIGVKAVAPTATSQPTATAQPTAKPIGPATGDTHDFTLLFVFGGASALAAAILIIKQKKRR